MKDRGWGAAPRAWADRLLQLDIFDLHHHLGSRARLSVAHAAQSGTLPNYDFDVDFAARTAMMDAHAIRAACLMPASSFSRPAGAADTARANDAVAVYRDKYAERFPVALGTLDLWSGDKALEELERLAGPLGLRGVVWHHRLQGAFLDHPLMRPILRRMADLGLPAFVHVIADSDMEALWRLEVLAEEFRSVTFVALDALSSPSQSRWALAVARRQPNILFDTGVLAPVGHTLDQFIRDIGDTRLLFGSDFYSHPPTYFQPAPLYEILAAPWPIATKARVLGGNARRLFGLV